MCGTRSSLGSWMVIDPVYCTRFARMRGGFLRHTTVSYALKTAFEASISWSEQYDDSDADLSRMSQPCTVSACFKLGQVDTA